MNAYIKKYIQKIFSIRNNENNKVWTIFGIKITLKRKKYLIQNLVNENLSEQRDLIISMQNDIKGLINNYYSVQTRLDDIFYNQQVLTQVGTMHSFFKQYKNCNKDKEIVLIASGPTLNYYKRIPNALHCGVNGSIRNIDYLDYLFCIDDYLHDSELNKEIITYKGNNCKKFFGILPQRRLLVLNQNVHFTERIRPTVINNANAHYFIHEDVWQNKWAVDLETEAFGDFGGSVFSALQFLLYTCPQKIYLVGNDCSTGQSFDRYSKANHIAKIDWYKIFKDFKDKVYPDVEIISVNPVGLKGIFKDVYTKEYLDIHLDIKNELGDNVKILEEV